MCGQLGNGKGSTQRFGEASCIPLFLLGLSGPGTFGHLGLQRTSICACKVGSKVYQCSPQVEMVALRDIVQTALMATTPAKFGGGGVDTKHLGSTAPPETWWFAAEGSPSKRC
jgi:hypothetical protein